MQTEVSGQLALLMDALKRDFYHPLCEIAFNGFCTQEQMTLEEAAGHEKQPMPEGVKWGDAWQYAWFFATCTVPKTAKGERIVMQLNPGGESTIFVDGEPFGTRRAEWVRVAHHYIVDQTLIKKAEGNECFSLALEVYGGTPLPASPFGRCATGPIFPEEGVRTEPLPPAVMGRNTIGIWNEEAYQLWLDMSVLLDTHDSQPEDSYWKEAIGEALGEVVRKLDMEQMLPQRRKAYAEMRTCLKPYMQAKNGSFSPRFSAIANSHLDVAWLWPLEETRRKVARTFAQQIRLLEEYPEARFLQSQAYLYEMCRQHYPTLFKKIQDEVRQGRWIVEGAMWVEPDTNLAGGEALIRQILYGKAYFKKYFDADCQVAWLPDSFGYSAVLPQILKKCGMTGLTTQKIYWSYNGGDPFPYHGFRWKGMDGTEVDCYLHMQYESFVDPKTLNERWRKRLIQDGTGEFYLPFGYGDGGGGPTRDDYEQIRREEDLQGVPKMCYETPEAFFVRRKGLKEPVYRGELYFPCHRGTYTTQAAIKQKNRQCEQAVCALELWASCAQVLCGADYPAEAIEALWKEILLNQFHDILPGSAIAQVYEEAKKRYDKTLMLIGEHTEQALAALTQPGDGVTVFGAQSGDVQRIVKLDERFARGIRTADGKNVPYTRTADGVWALLNLPAFGSVSVFPCEAEEDRCTSTVSETEAGFVLNNGLIEAHIGRDGTVLRCIDLASGTERVGGVSNRFALYRDVPRAFDAWDVDSQVFEREVEAADETEVSVVLRGGVRAAVRITHRLLNSVITQTISLEAMQKRLDFETTVDWHERHKLLKVLFDTGISSADAANQIQFGYVNRPTHRSRPADRDRFEVCNHGYTALHDATHGAAVLNDCKYGVSMDEAKIGLTLLRGATHPDGAADQGLHHFTYAYYVWDDTFQQSGIVCETEKLNVPVLTAQGLCGVGSFLRTDDSSAVIEAVKMAEDGSGDLILRIYESMGGARKTHLTACFAMQNVWLCSMLEEKETLLEAKDNTVELALQPFEILTLRVAR